MVSLIADGVSFSFGLIYTELLKSFNEGETKTAIVGSLFMSVPLLVGPIMSNLVDKYGCQRMTMIGGVLGCAGFVLSTLTDSIGVMFITFGFISGVGLGVIYVTGKQTHFITNNLILNCKFLEILICTFVFFDLKLS